MREITLTQGKVALVDDEDYDRAIERNWFAHQTAQGMWYAHSHTRLAPWKYCQTGLQNIVLNLPREIRIDHRDGNGLNNQKSNLRPCNQQQNMHNRKPTNGKQYKGTGRTSAGKPFKAQIHKEGKNYWLGVFDTEEQAARAYDAKAKELFGEFAWLNFPE